MDLVGTLYTHAFEDAEEAYHQARMSGNTADMDVMMARRDAARMARDSYLNNLKPPQDPDVLFDADNPETIPFIPQPPIPVEPKLTLVQQGLGFIAGATAAVIAGTSGKDDRSATPTKIPTTTATPTDPSALPNPLPVPTDPFKPVVPGPTFPTLDDPIDTGLPKTGDVLPGVPGIVSKGYVGYPDLYLLSVLRKVRSSWVSSHY